MARKSRKGLATAPALAPVSPVKVWRAALYIRQSVEGSRGDTLETQRQIMEAYLAICPDIEIVGTYVDNGVSGRTFDRPGFQTMLADIETGKINCVVVKDLSRLGRNLIDTGFYIERYFPLHQVRFLAVNDHYDSEDAENSGSHITVPLKDMVSEAYAADISKKVRSQLHQSMRDGEYVGSFPRYGYRKDPENCHKLLVNEETAPVVQEIFSWCAEGVPLNQIVLRLNEKAIPTPGQHLADTGHSSNQRMIGDGKWKSRIVAKILSDEIYTGDLVQGKHKKVAHKLVPTPPEEWVVVRGTHEAIISHDLFDRVQAVRAQAAAKRSGYAKTPRTTNILRGRIFCGHCGRNLQREKIGKYYYYRCITNVRIEKGACEAKSHLREDALYDLILSIIRQQAETVLGNALLLKQKDGALSQRKEEMEKKIESLQQEINVNRRYLSSLYENLVTGVLTTAEYREMKSGYEGKIRQTMEAIQQLQEARLELDQQCERYISMADRLEAVRQDTTLTAMLVEHVIERVTVNSWEDITVQFRFESGFERLWAVMRNA